MLADALPPPPAPPLPPGPRGLKTKSASEPSGVPLQESERLGGCGEASPSPEPAKEPWVARSVAWEAATELPPSKGLRCRWPRKNSNDGHWNSGDVSGTGDLGKANAAAGDPGAPSGPIGEPTTKPTESRRPGPTGEPTAKTESRPPPFGPPPEPAPAPGPAAPGAFTRVGESCLDRIVGLKRAWVPCASPFPGEREAVAAAAATVVPPTRGGTKPECAKPSMLSRRRRPGGGPMVPAPAGCCGGVAGGCGVPVMEISGPGLPGPSPGPAPPPHEPRRPRSGKAPADVSGRVAPGSGGGRSSPPARPLSAESCSCAPRSRSSSTGA